MAASGKSPRNVQIYHNTIIGSKQDACLRGVWSAGNNFVIANNAILCEESPKGPVFSVNNQAGVTWVNNAVHPNSGLPPGPKWIPRSCNRTYIIWLIFVMCV
jgi:hypothetical protein